MGWCAQALPLKTADALAKAAAVAVTSNRAGLGPDADEEEAAICRAAAEGHAYRSSRKQQRLGPPTNDSLDLVWVPKKDQSESFPALEELRVHVT